MEAVFNSAYQALPADAARMYRLAGLWPGPHLDTDAAAALADLPTEAASDLLNVLDEASLIDEIAYRRFQFHDLVRAHAQHQAAQTESAEERHQAISRAI